jgi:hypothetical protein
LPHHHCECQNWRVGTFVEINFNYIPTNIIAHFLYIYFHGYIHDNNLLTNKLLALLSWTSLLLDQMSDFNSYNLNWNLHQSWEIKVCNWNLKPTSYCNYNSTLAMVHLTIYLNLKISRSCFLGIKVVNFKWLTLDFIPYLIFDLERERKRQNNSMGKKSILLKEL